MAKSTGSRTRKVPKPSAHGNPRKTPRQKTAPQHPVKHSAPKISPGFKLGRLPPDR
jgi:hypothetical protein